MKQPIPRNDTEPLKVGDRVQIVPEWQDPGDEEFEPFVIEAPKDCNRVASRPSFPTWSYMPPSGSRRTD